MVTRPCHDRLRAIVLEGLHDVFEHLPRFTRRDRVANARFRYDSFDTDLCKLFIA